MPDLISQGEVDPMLEAEAKGRMSDGGKSSKRGHGKGRGKNTLPYSGKRGRNTQPRNGLSVSGKTARGKNTQRNRALSVSGKTASGKNSQITQGTNSLRVSGKATTHAAKALDVNETYVKADLGISA